MKTKKKKVTKKRKKFFIILGCYLAVFIITCLTTVATLAWFNGSTFANNTIYLGGPVYLYFGDTNNKETSKSDKLTLDTPPGWDLLYPGMNIRLQARAVVQGAEFENTNIDGTTTTVTATGAILRARIMINVLPPEGSNLTEEQVARITQDIYNNIWLQAKAKALSNVDDRNEGVWIFDGDYNYSTDNREEDHFFYYVKSGQTVDNSGKYELLDVGGTTDDVSVGFLDNAVITLSGLELTNDHADCRIRFTIIFHGLQAFLPYTADEVGKANYLGNTEGRSDKVLISDIGTPKPLTVENSRPYFREAFEAIYEGTTNNNGTIY